MQNLLAIEFWCPFPTTGGLRIFLEHMRLQLQRGHSITAVFRPGRNDQHTALPAWGAAGLEGVQQIVLQPNQPLSSLAVLHQPGTVVLPGTFHQVPEALASVGPESVVLYLEQVGNFRHGYNWTLPNSTMAWHHHWLLSCKSVAWYKALCLLWVQQPLVCT
jgi:hypothetical protein